MRITRLTLLAPPASAGGARHELSLDQLHPHLSVFCGVDPRPTSALASLIGHLLYGKVDSGESWQSATEGAVSVSSGSGDFVLRRHRDGTPQGRLTIASSDGSPVDSTTIRTLLGDWNPTYLGQLYAVDFTEQPRIDALLSEGFADEFSIGGSMVGGADHPSHDPICWRHETDSPSSKMAVSSKIDRRAIDELIARRDELARRLELEISGRRSDSASLERELSKLDAALAGLRVRAEKLQVQLTQIDSRRADAESRLRYLALESTVRTVADADVAERRQELAELDEEIERCRKMLGDQQRRESRVRQELAALHPDGAGDGRASLADQRATLSVFEELLGGLDAEIALLARSHEPGRCVGLESHARMTPLAEMLRRQLYAMCGQVTEQQRAERRQQLEQEERHLCRAQADLSDQLELLLARRQSLTHESLIPDHRTIARPQAPIDDYCQCHGHLQFVQHWRSKQPGGNGALNEQQARDERIDLDRQRQSVFDELEDVQREISAIESRWDQLQQRRGRVVGQSQVGRSSLDDLRRELAQLEAEIEKALKGPAKGAAGHELRSVRSGWRASDVLAQLTGGRLTQIRLARDGKTLSVVDRRGTARALRELTPAETDQTYLAITLALVGSQADRGVHLPLVLEEPFVRQERADALTMAGVLHEFANQGRQVLIFTGDRQAGDQLESLGIALRHLDSRSTKHADTAAVRASSRPAVSPTQTPSPTNVRVVRESASDREPRLRVHGDWRRRDDEDVYFLTVDAPLEEFPVLGSATAETFSALGIQTVEQLLQADPEAVAGRLGREGVTLETVRLWQIHMALMCFVPGVSLDDAQILAACGIETPDKLLGSDPEELLRILSEFFASRRGERFAHLRARYSQDTLERWQTGAQINRSRWTRAAKSWVTTRDDARSRKDRKAQSTYPNGRSERGTERRRRRDGKPARKLRFFLQRSSDVADAPSIGPKTAERLAAVGIRTVADLLNADAESTASEIDASHIKARTLAAWQHQARLVCCIPELRGYCAQLLVGAGFTEPEQVANSDVDELVEIVQRFAQTKEGQRILRDGDPPSAEKIGQWADWAAEMRPLEAA